MLSVSNCTSSQHPHRYIVFLLFIVQQISLDCTCLFSASFHIFLLSLLFLKNSPVSSVRVKSKRKRERESGKNLHSYHWHTEKKLPIETYQNLRVFFGKATPFVFTFAFVIIPSREKVQSCTSSQVLLFLIF